MSTAPSLAKPIRVPMAGIGYAASGETLETLLGSCLGIALWCPIVKVGGLAHAMLPEGPGQGRRYGHGEGRFIDTALPAMLDELDKRGAKRRCLIAKLCGGANMFAALAKGTDVGERNHAAARQLLQSLRIPIQGEHIGGNAGRVIRFQADDGAVQVEIGRQWVATL